MTSLPRIALLLGLAGLIPFVFGALVASGVIWAHKGDPEGLQGYGLLRASDGVNILIAYGTVILSFMSGVLWGFATKGNKPVFYTLSVFPALWVFFTMGGHVFSASTRAPDILVSLIIGFLGLLLLDGVFARAGLAPTWWMSLRLFLTGVAAVCLGVGLVT